MCQWEGFWCYAIIPYNVSPPTDKNQMAGLHSRFRDLRQCQHAQYTPPPSLSRHRQDAMGLDMSWAWIPRVFLYDKLVEINRHVGRTKLHFKDNLKLAIKNLDVSVKTCEGPALYRSSWRSLNSRVTAEGKRAARKARPARSCPIYSLAQSKTPERDNSSPSLDSSATCADIWKVL